MALKRLVQRTTFCSQRKLFKTLELTTLRFFVFLMCYVKNKRGFMKRNIYLGDKRDATLSLVSSIEIKMSPNELAIAFKEMTTDDKAMFFEELHAVYRGEECFSEEIKKITASKNHSLNGKWMMCEIGQGVRKLQGK